MTHGQLLGDLDLGIDHLVRADLVQQVSLNVLACLGHDAARAVLLQQTRDDQGGLKILADRDKADVEIRHAKRHDHGLVRAVADARVGEAFAHALDDSAVVVDDHHVVAELHHFSGEVTPHAPHADDQNRFHMAFLRLSNQ